VRRALLVAAASLALAAPAGAAVRIGGVDTSGYPELRLTVVAPGKPYLREDGRGVAGAQVANLGLAKSVVLAVDRSQSMSGQSLRDASAATRGFVASKRAGDRIQVVGFGREALGLTTFSSSPTDALAVLGSLRADGRSGTALYDAIVRASTALRRENQPGRVILVVTDGADVSSRATLETAIAAAQRARASVYAIGIAGPDFTPDPLRRLAAGTGGTYLQARSSADLSALYSHIGNALAHTWQVRYVTAARPGERVSLAVGAAGQGTTRRQVELRVSGFDGVAAAPTPAVLPRGVWRSDAAPAVLAAAVGALVLLALWFFAAARGGSWLQSRITPHLGTPQAAVRGKRRRQTGSLRKRIVAATESAFANVKQFRALQRLLTRADLPLLAAELLYICIGVGLFFALIGTALGTPALITFVLMVGGGSAPVWWVWYRARSRAKAFDNQLPDLLITIAASLKAGHSFRHAIQAVVEEGADPAAKEFRRVLTETRLGRPMDVALGEMGERVGSRNLTFVLNSVSIQRQIGGSLAGLFDMVAETVRQRQQFQRKIRSLTAMGRMSAYVLGGLPFAVAVLISLINPSYMQPLWHSDRGHQMVGAGLVMLGIGGAFLKKIVSFKG
jgi:tight adherence protein B